MISFLYQGGDHMQEKQVFYVNGFLGVNGILLLAFIGVFCLVEEMLVIVILAFILASV
ncbi:SPFH domain-containing protein, partial [Bacillus mycoides]|nr:SPFH domain-containing protein [Bacillus mycoides]